MGARSGAVVVGVLAVLVEAREVRAGDEDYGEQIALADAASIATFMGATHLAVRWDSEHLDLAIAAGLGSYLLSAPAVHLLGHGEGDRAMASLGMCLVPVLAFVSTGTCGGGEDALGCVLSHLLIATLGAMTATAVDVFAVADGSSEEPRPIRFGLSGRF